MMLELELNSSLEFKGAVTAYQQNLCYFFKKVFDVHSLIMPYKFLTNNSPSLRNFSAMGYTMTEYKMPGSIYFRCNNDHYTLWPWVDHLCFNGTIYCFE